MLYKQLFWLLFVSFTYNHVIEVHFHFRKKQSLEKGCRDILRTVGFSLPAGNNNSKLVSIVVEVHNKSFSINLEIKLSIQLVLEQFLIYSYSLL